MNKRETAMLLGRISVIDGRKLPDTAVETWHEIIGHMPYAEAVEALRIVASQSVDIIKPAHLLRARSTARAQIERRERRASRQRELDASTRQQRIAALGAEIEGEQR